MLSAVCATRPLITYSFSMNLYRRALRITGSIFVVYALLVATHLGEFWPFSIYPMFSQAGNPWSRAVVRQINTEPEALPWDTLQVDELPGEPLPLQASGIDPIDVANFVSKTDTWTPSRVAALESLFSDELSSGRKLLVTRVNGHIGEDDSVRVYGVPYVFLSADTTVANPALW